MAGVELGTLSVKIAADALPFARDMKQVEKQAQQSARKVERAIASAGKPDTFGPLREHAKRLSNELEGLAANFRATGGDANEFARSMEMVRVRALAAAQGLDKTSSEYVQLQQTAARAQAAIDSANRSSVAAESSLGGLRNVVAGLGLTLGVTTIAGAAIGMVELSNNAQAATRALEAVSGSSAEAAANAQALREAVNFSVTGLDAERIAASLLSRELVKNSQDLRKFAEDAALVGKAFGGFTASEAIFEVSSAISNFSIERLDMLGISSANVRARMDEMQAAQAGLSREQAFGMAVMEELARSAQKLRESGFQAGSGVEALKAALHDAAVEASTVFGPAIDGAAEGAAKFVRSGLTRAADLREETALLRETADALEALGKVEKATALRRQAQALELGPRAGRAEDVRARAQEIIKAADAEAIFAQSVELSRGRVEAANPELFTHGRAIEAAGQMAGPTQAQIDALNKVIGDISPAAFAAGQGLSALEEEIRATGAAATEAGARALAAIGVLRRLRNERPELFDPSINQATAAETRGVATSVAGRRRVAEDVEAANKVVTESNKRALDTWWDDYQTTLRRIEQGTKKTANETEKAFEQAYNRVKGAVERALSLDVSVSDEDALLEQFGLRLPDPAEAGRRIQDVINRGIESPWAQAFDEFEGKQGEELKAIATRLLMDFQAGLRPDLIDVSAVEVLAERILVGDANMENIADTATQNLINKGFDPTRVQNAIGAALGGPLGAGMSAAFSQGLQGFTATAAPQLQGAATEIVAPAVEAVTAATDGLGESVGTTLGEPVEQFATERGPALAKEFDSITEAIEGAHSAWAGFVKALQGFHASIQVSVTAGGGDATGFASGGDFIVPPGFPDDSFLMGVTSGEHVTVTPAGQSGSAGGLTVPIIQNFYGPAEPAVVRRESERGVLSAARSVGVR